MRFVGIDPGLDGGIAILAPDENPWVRVMPVFPTGKGREIDLCSLTATAETCGDFTCAIEYQQCYPKQGGKSNFTIGYNYGKLVAWLEVNAIRYEVVKPRLWQKHFAITSRGGLDTKAQAAQVCRRLFPCVELLATPRCRKPHSGICDALLIAEWCRRREQGGRADG